MFINFYLLFSIIFYNFLLFFIIFYYFLFFSIIFNTFYWFSFAVDKKLLSVIWAITVSLLIIQFISDQLFSQLTADRFSWPRSYEELAVADDIDFLTTNQRFLEFSGIPSLKKIATKTKDKPILIDDFLGKLRLLSNGHTAFIGRTTEVEWMHSLLHPDKFAVVDETYFLSQYVFGVSTKWPYHKRFIKM